MDWHSLTPRDLAVVGATLTALLSALGFAVPRLWRLLGMLRDHEAADRERAELIAGQRRHDERLDLLERDAARVDERVASIRREINARVDAILGELRDERREAASRWRAAEARLLRAVRGALRGAQATGPGPGAPPTGRA